MTSLFVTRLFFLFIMQFTRSLTKDLRATRARLKKLCILFKSTLFVLGLRTSTRELTAEALTKSVLLTQKSTFFQEHTAQVFSQEVKHRYFQLLLSVRCQTLSFLTVLTSRLKRDISITTTSRHTL